MPPPLFKTTTNTAIHSLPMSTATNIGKVPLSIHERGAGHMITQQKFLPHIIDIAIFVNKLEKGIKGWAACLMIYLI